MNVSRVTLSPETKIVERVLTLDAIRVYSNGTISAEVTDHTGSRRVEFSAAGAVKAAAEALHSAVLAVVAPEGGTIEPVPAPARK